MKESSARQSCTSGNGKCDNDIESKSIREVEDDGITDVTIVTVVIGIALTSIAIFTAGFVGYKLVKHRKTVNEKKLLGIELRRQAQEKSERQKKALSKKYKSSISSDTQSSFGKSKSSFGRDSVTGFLDTRPI